MREHWFLSIIAAATLAASVFILSGAYRKATGYMPLRLLMVPVLTLPILGFHTYGIYIKQNDHFFLVYSIITFLTAFSCLVDCGIRRWFLKDKDPH